MWGVDVRGEKVFDFGEGGSICLTKGGCSWEVISGAYSGGIHKTPLNQSKYSTVLVDIFLIVCFLWIWDILFWNYLVWWTLSGLSGSHLRPSFFNWNTILVLLVQNVIKFVQECGLVSNFPISDLSIYCIYLLTITATFRKFKPTKQIPCDLLDWNW